MPVGQWSKRPYPRSSHTVRACRQCGSAGPAAAHGKHSVGNAGAALGLAVASCGTHAALRILPAALPRSGAIGVDRRVLAFTLVISLLSGLVRPCGALKILHADMQGALKEGGRGISGAKQHALSVFAVLEVAMALFLLAGAVRPVVDRRYRLSEVPEAIRYLEEGHASRKGSNNFRLTTNPITGSP